jgi:hypothetical protein
LIGDGAAAIYADASGEGGFMAWGVGGVGGTELLYVEGEWTPAERRELIICEKELLASTLGLVALAPWLSDRVLSFTDNTVAMAAMRQMGSRSAGMQEMLVRRTTWLYATGRTEAAARITSKANDWADWGSRGRLGEVLVAATALGLQPRRVEAPAAWRDTTALRAAAAACP